MAGPMGQGGPGRRFNMDTSKPKNTKETIKRLFSYLSKDKFKIIAAFVCVVVAALTNLAGSYILRPIINGLIENIPMGERVANLMQGLLFMAFIYAVGIVANYLQQRIMLDVSQSAIKKLRADLFEKMQKLPVKFFDTNTTGQIMSRYTNDMDTIGNMLSTTIVQIFSGIISLTGTLCLMLYTNVWLTLVTIVMVPIMAKTGTTIASRSRKYFRSQQEALGEVNGYIEETVTGQKVVKVFSHEEKATAEFGELNEKLKEQQVKAQFAGGMMGPCMNALGQVNYTLTACVGALLCVYSGFDVGGVAVFVNFSRQFSRPINELSQQLTVIMSALAGAERVFGVMNQEGEKESKK